MIRHVVVMAGGSGTRLWPASRSWHPKQFLNLGTGKTLFQETLLRAAALKLKGKIIIVTHRNQIDFILDQLNALFSDNSGRGEIVVLAEPEAKNTAPAVMLASRFLEAVGESGSSVAVLPADHFISPIERFKSDIGSAADIAARDKLVTFGIEPSGPETGYGYIEAGETFKSGFLVKKFREKPDAKTAKEFLERGNFYWNSGIFVFKVGVFLSEMKTHSPKLYSHFKRHSFTESLTRAGDNLFVVPADTAEELYKKLPSISVDYAVMEKSLRSAMVKASFQWSDVGSWDEVARVAHTETKDVFSHEAEGNFVFSDMPVALVGVDDLLVIQKKDALLICKKGESQKIRDIVDKIRKKRRGALL